MFSAAILARAVPHDPEPTIATLCFPEGSGEAGSGDANGDGGRVAAEEGENVSTPVLQTCVQSLGPAPL